MNGSTKKQGRNKTKLGKFIKVKPSKPKFNPTEDRLKRTKLENRVQTPFYAHKKLKKIEQIAFKDEDNSNIYTLTPTPKHVSTSDFSSNECSRRLLLPSTNDCSEENLTKKRFSKDNQDQKFLPKKLFKPSPSLNNSLEVHNSNFDQPANSCSDLATPKPEKKYKPLSQRQKTPYKVRKRKSCSKSPVLWSLQDPLSCDSFETKTLNEEKSLLHEDVDFYENLSGSFHFDEKSTFSSSPEDLLKNFNVDNAIVEFIPTYNTKSDESLNEEVLVFDDSNHSLEPIKERENANDELSKVGEQIETAEKTEEVIIEEDKKLIVEEEEEIEDFTRSSAVADYFEVPAGLIVVLHTGKLYFNGLFSLTCLQGAVEILGCTLTPARKNVPIFSPRGSAFLYLEPAEHYNELETMEALDGKLNHLGLTPTQAEDICKQFRKPTVILLLQRIASNVTPFIEKHIPQQIYPKGTNSSRPQCIFYPESINRNVFNVNPEWDAFIGEMKHASRVFVCGGKGVGKSVFLRYLINRLNYDQVLFIDLDVGQSEFTIPGAISASIIDKPLLGPNYTHLGTPKKCFFVPFINVTQDCESYLRAVKALVQFTNTLPTLPTLINYMGFTRGLGLNLTASTIALVKPDVVVEIQSAARQQNFAEKMTVAAVENNCKLLTADVTPSPYNLVIMQSMSDNQGWHLHSRQLREMSILSYFSQVLPENTLSLTNGNVPVYAVDLQSIKILNNGREIQAAVINGNLVSLCSNGSSDIFTCHGWGIVRGIDVNAQKLYLITPLDVEELDKVDCVVLGSVALPPTLQMTADANKGLIPYVAEGISTFGQIPKRSHLPAKKNVT